MPYDFSVSFGRLLTSFMISLSFSPTTAWLLAQSRPDFSMSNPPNMRTCSTIVPINCHRALEQGFVALELAKSIGCACGILYHTAGLRWSKILENAVQLIAGGSSLLNFCRFMISSSFLSIVNQLISRSQRYAAHVQHIPSSNSVLSNLLCF